MTRYFARESGFFAPRLLIATAVALAGLVLGLYSVAAAPSRPRFARPAAALTAAASSVTDWSFAGSPNLTDQDFAAVTCVTTSDCWAVGNFTDSDSIQEPLIEHWNGTSWSIVDSNANLGQNSTLNAVTCTSSTNCWAVGWFQGDNAQQTLIERWNGTFWAIFPSDNSSTTAANLLNAVTCSSATDCWAVGSRQTATGAQTLIERWTGGASWAIVTSPNMTTGQGASEPNVLNGVTCTATTNCFAVGSFDTGATGQRTLIERWNGTAWSIVMSTPNAPTGSNVLNAVACPSSTDCSAVGLYDNGPGTADQTLVLRWTGSTWSLVSSPNVNTTQDNTLQAIICTSTTNCWAVGSYNTSEFTGIISHTLIERWNGSTWATTTSPNTDSLLSNELSGVACGSASDCWAVGSFNNSVDQTLAQHWTGSNWSIVASPNEGASGTFNKQNLIAIACSGPNDCWVVGNFDPGTGIDQTLIEHWDGSMWTIVNSPNTGAFQPNFLNAISCTSASNCWAAGYYAFQGVHHTLIQRWDGVSWTIVASPNTNATLDNLLNGITCSSASQCWAVGGADNGSVSQTLIEQWNGMSWSIVPSPNTSNSVDNQFNAVSCAAANDCWAVGTANNGAVTQTYTAHWNGVAPWSPVASPSTSASQQNFLNSVTCLSSSSCWAAGGFVQGTLTRTLILKWNGAAWSIISSPNTNNTDANDFFGVACVSGFDCSAVGFSGNNIIQTLTDRWNGVAWNIVASPDSSVSEPNLLSGVACVPGAFCWAVGSYTPASTGFSQTLILQRSAPLVSTTTVSRSAGHFILTGKAVPNSMVNIYATQSLPNGFTFLGSATADGNGNFQYDDAGAVNINPPRRFYQPAYP